MLELHHYVALLDHMAQQVFAESVRRTQMDLVVTEVEQAKERVKLLVRNVVHQELVKRAPTILIPVLQVILVNVVQLPHVEELQCLIISVQTLHVNVDHRLRELLELH